MTSNCLGTSAMVRMEVETAAFVNYMCLVWESQTVFYPSSTLYLGDLEY